MTTVRGNPKGVVITGGGTGIGRAAARAFAGAGAEVLIVGRTRSTLAETAEGHPGIDILATDLNAAEAPNQIVSAAVDRFGRIDVLVNNAVSVRPGALGGIDRREAAADLATNLYAPIMLTRRALAPLEAGRGVVVNVGTYGVLGIRAWPFMSVYGAGKTAVDFLTRTWAVELAPRGIRVVGVSPGVTDTGIGLRMGATQEENAHRLEQRRQRVPVRRLATPAEMAWWITRLVEPDSKYATGTVLAVDGGASLV
ncbi:SDR family NAD(P)-dependent oxidoreductase [Spirillospora sp. NPDC050679]